MAGKTRQLVCASIWACAMLAGQPLIAGDTAPADSLSSVCRSHDAQRGAETMALALLKTPVMQQAKAEAARQWLAQWGPVSDEAMMEFPRALDELVFNAALKTVVNAAPPPAMAMMINRPQRTGAGEVPGTRYGWDNTDNIYGNIPVNPAATYRISGVMPANGTNLNLSVWSDDMVVLGNLARSDIRTDAKGRFSLTVGAQDGADIRLSPGAHHIMVRETLPDWDRDTPVYFDVVQTGGEKPRTPSPEELATVAAAAIPPMVTKLVGWRASLYRKYPANEFVAPWMGLTSNGGLPNQAYSIGSFKLKDDEALVFDIGAGGAEYFSFQLSDIWGTSGNFVDHVSMLTLKGWACFRFFTNTFNFFSWNLFF